jgi:chemotaxis methyl-accepting protein methylase
VSNAVKDVSVIEEDIEKNGAAGLDQVDVIRAANILNLAYFPEDRLRNMIKLISRRLRTGGLFIVCRTHSDGTNHASVSRFEQGRLAVLGRLGNGSEIEHLFSSIGR